jgi:molybdate transport system substrate-binding protein
MTSSLSLYMAGSCAQLIDDLRAPYAQVMPGVELVSARVAMTGTIAAEVLAGAPADVFLSANRDYANQLHAAGLMPEPVHFAGNRLALLVSPGSTEKVRGLDDLARDDVTTLVMPPHDDPCGAYTAALFERAGLSVRMQEQERAGRLIVLHPGKRDPRVSFDDPAIDARILYRSVASRMGAFVLVELPPPWDMSDRIEFVAGAIERNGVRHPGADAFVHLLIGPAGQAVLRHHDFLPVEVTGAGH